MISYFKNGIADTKCTTDITIDIVEAFIRANPKKELIQQLHKLEYKSPAYNKLKVSLPNITPHGSFSYRAAEHLKQLSGILYFDIDKEDIVGDVETCKQSLIKDYKDIIYMLGTSIGGRGIFFYIKVADLEKLNSNSFDIVYSYVKKNVLKSIKTDTNATGVSRAQFIPYDENLYVNKNALLKLDYDEILRDNIHIINSDKIINHNKNDKLSKQVKKGIKQDNNKPNTCNILNDTLAEKTYHNFIPIRELFKTLTFETKVDIGAADYLIKPVQYAKIFTGERFKDGTKHKRFPVLINKLMFLNPDITLHEVKSYLWWVNETKTYGTKMLPRELIRTTEITYNQVRTNGVQCGTRIKILYTNPKLPRKARITISNEINGFLRKEKSYEIIFLAYSILNQQQKQITQKNVFELIQSRSDILQARGISLPTIKRHWREVINNLELMQETFLQD